MPPPVPLQKKLDAIGSTAEKDNSTELILLNSTDFII